MYFTLIVILIIVFLSLFLVFSREKFVIDSSYLNPNYEGGANLIRGDLPIEPVQQSWFNTPYGPDSLAPSFMQF